MVFAFVTAVFGLLLWKIVKWTWNSRYLVSWRQSNSMVSELENDLGNVTSPASVNNTLVHGRSDSRRKLKERVKAVDTFRGISIAMMIFINYGGGGYWIFDHSPWNGLTVADLVFPWFAWIMGVSASLFLRSQLRNTTSRKKLFGHILRRSLLLVLVGVALNTFGGYRNGLQNIRVLGVLQRLGLSYLAVASLEAIFMKPQRMVISGFCMNIEDILECWKQWVVVISLVTCHACLTFLLKVPDCPLGYLGPGGLHNLGKHENCTGGAAGYVDRAILGEKHLYQRPTCQKIYKTSIPFDPEGILGTLTTILLVFLGVQAGRILMTYGNSASRIVRWSIWSVLTGLIAGFLCNFSKEEGIIPVNKNLWSLSYVLSTASMAFLLFAILFYTIDIRNWWDGRPFSYAGLNPILLYVGHCLTKNMFPWFWEPFYNSHGELLAMNMWATALWITISYCLFHYNVFLSL
ncbi:heparan-alpha-glucosaminide N-acetyltransferase-like [Hetaerina americana]|uniref:heparan-alpha-glucosaminide N-acetyltransferase-like n=1 Tax=Hetaerina americana TaxID=62018 RepID=UPI003A7F2FE1